ncbi:hypothetical protein HU200_013478 [Digitaria exilis]|uniref:C2H2-type domain-containing protein n=1 Tax=Digitaria exilis TaxID=1010633 RepID=A0A835FDL2_9POAL|nr:hypothetical protein HU200_013478 [Digitaria exilis]
MPCPPPPMDTATTTAKTCQVNKTKSRGAAASKKTTSHQPSSSSWMTMGFSYRSSSSTKNKAHNPAAVPVTPSQCNKNNNNDKTKTKKTTSMSSISRSITNATSICISKDTSILTRRNRGDIDDRSRTASSRSLKIPSDLDVDAVYSAAVSTTSSFNSDATSAMASSASVTTTVTTTTTASSSPLSSPAPSFAAGSSFRGVHQIRKLSGCYECRHSVFDPRSLAAAAAVFHCSDCGEVFVKADSLELHKATKHAVSELGPEDTSRNIVEIIFKSSWLMRKQAPVCKIDRILKVQNSDRTVKRFEQYKESIKERASGDEGKKNARCVADGNELLRFHCTTFTCSIGAAGGTALCRSPEMQCKLCAIIRDGFRVDGDGKIATMATSGRAHDVAEVVSEGEKKAMLVCRVVAGRVKKACGTTKSSEDRDVDSVSPSSETVYSDLDELFVFNPRAILPCFVVIYSGY